MLTAHFSSNEPFNLLIFCTSYNNGIIQQLHHVTLIMAYFHPRLILLEVHIRFCHPPTLVQDKVSPSEMNPSRYPSIFYHAPCYSWPQCVRQYPCVRFLNGWLTLGKARKRFMRHTSMGTLITQGRWRDWRAIVTCQKAFPHRRRWWRFHSSFNL